MKDFASINIKSPESGKGFIVTTKGEDVPMTETLHANWDDAEKRINVFMTSVAKRAKRGEY